MGSLQPGGRTSPSHILHTVNITTRPYSYREVAGLRPRTRPRAGSRPTVPGARQSRPGGPGSRWSRVPTCRQCPVSQWPEWGSPAGDQGGDGQPSRQHSGPRPWTACPLTRSKLRGSPHHPSRHPGGEGSTRNALSITHPRGFCKRSAQPSELGEAVGPVPRRGKRWEGRAKGAAPRCSSFLCPDHLCKQGQVRFWQRATGWYPFIL